MRGLDLEIVWRSTDALTAHPANPRRHSDAQKEQLFASVSRFGWTVPIIVDEELTILAGHGRLEMALDNKIEQVPTIEIHGLTEDEKRAYLIADNKLSENANWDIPQLLNELEYLATQAIDSDTLGFSDADILHYQSQIDDTGFTDAVEAQSSPAPRFAPRIESSTEPTQLQSDQSGFVAPADYAGGPTLEVAATLVPFSLMLPVDDRERVYAVLNHVRGDDRSMAEALMLVIDAFDAEPDGQGSDDDQQQQ